MNKNFVNNKVNEPPDFYDKVIQPPWGNMDGYDKQKWEYDIWKRGGGYNSWIPNLVGLRASVTELNYSIGLRSSIQVQLDAKANILDLGTMAEQNADAVDITGGVLTNITITNSNASFNVLGAADATMISLQSDTIKSRVGTSLSYAESCSALNVNSTPAVNSGSSETPLMEYTIPGNALSTTTAIKVTAFGSYAANANNKTLKLYLGSATILNTGPIVANDKNWQIQTTILCTSGSSQQTSSIIISNEPSLGASSFIASASEAIASDILLVLTGEGITSSDITQHGLVVEWMKSA